MAEGRGTEAGGARRARPVGREEPRPPGGKGTVGGLGKTRRATSTGPGRVLIAVYAIFALSATARAAVQLAFQFHQAPLAYLLSAFSGVVYILATIGLARTGTSARRLAWVAVSIELIGVLVIGSLSVFDPVAFPRATVWSGYGAGYGWVPLVLPVLGLLWLRKTGRTGSEEAR